MLYFSVPRNEKKKIDNNKEKRNITWSDDRLLAAAACSVDGIPVNRCGKKRRAREIGSIGRLDWREEGERRFGSLV